jgi:uncharacterized protein (TIGR00369 family)
MSEDLGTAAYTPQAMAVGEFAGWTHWAHDPYETRSGPFFYRTEDDGGIVSAFRAEPRHMNGGGFMHGGCLMTFADFALFAIATKELEGGHAVTLNLAGDFLDPAQVGQLIEARGEVVRAGGKTLFVQGLVTADGAPALRFNGIIRKIRRN